MTRHIAGAGLRGSAAVPAAAREAAAAALARLRPDLLRAARAIARCPDRAEDLAQEALLRVWIRLVAGERIDDLRPYLLTTLRNLARRPPRLLPAELAAPEAAPGNASDRMACREVIAAMGALPAGQATLLAEAALGDGTVAELAARAGLPPGTVASRVSRARASLRARFDLPEAAPVTALLDR